MSDAHRDTRIEDLEREVARLRRLLDTRDMPATLRHQVRNALGLMRAILRRSAETSTTVEDYAAHLEGRFDALLRVQSLLIAGSDEGVDLYALITNELVAHVIHEGDKATLEGPPVRVPGRTAELLALAFHELTTNAIKFGAITEPTGRIAVTWSVSGESPQILDLEWRETGLTSLSPTPAFRGFGMETLEKMLHYQSRGGSRLDFLPEGLRYTMRLPLPIGAEPRLSF